MRILPITLAEPNAGLLTDRSWFVTINARSFQISFLGQAPRSLPQSILTGSETEHLLCHVAK